MSELRQPIWAVISRDTFIMGGVPYDAAYAHAQSCRRRGQPAVVVTMDTAARLLGRPIKESF